jgi:outer membrane receptor protein involved in Fe transport
VRVGRSSLVVVAAVLVSVAARADEPSLEPHALSTLSLEELVDVDVTAPAKVAQPIREAPAVGAVVPRSQIERYGWLSLNDVLFRQPGFAPSQDFERTTVSGRGSFESWNNNHLLMLVDGVPFNNTSNGWAYTFDLFPLSLLDNAEVLRGPGSALYGTNATNGVVAVNTRAPSNEVPVEAHARLGNAGTQQYEVVGGHRWSLLSVLLAYSHHRTDGNVYQSYDGSGRTNADGSLEKFTVADRDVSHYAFVKVEGQGALRGLSLQLHYHYWHFQTAQGWLFVVPDQTDRTIQDRQIGWLRYRPPAWLDDRLQLELVVRGQRHEVDYRVKYLPDGATFAGTAYPGGVVEVAQSAPLDLFARAQAQYRLREEMTLLLGVEDTLFTWPADRRHESNVDINRGGTLQPFPDGFHPIRPLFESVIDRPIDNVGLFFQYASGRVLRRLLAATLGIRYDLQFARYHDLDVAGQPLATKSFDQISPRLGLVAFPHPALSVKAMVERAFRAPAPSELFVTNSLLGNSKTDQLKPEQVTTVTLAADAMLVRHLNLRADWFYENFANEIAFSATKNYSANLYSRRLTGVESEVLFDAPVGRQATLGGFLNYTFVHQLSESVEEPTIVARDRLTWAPEHVGNGGLDATFGRLAAAIQGHVQGRVRRRPSDHEKPDGTPTFFSAYRHITVPPWFTLDARLQVRITDWVLVGVQGTNVFDKRGYLVKTNDYPFDYQIPGARVLATLELAPKVAPTKSRP